MVFHSASYIIHQEYLLSTLLSNALITLQTHFIVSKKLWVELKREKKKETATPTFLKQLRFVLPLYDESFCFEELLPQFLYDHLFAGLLMDAGLTAALAAAVARSCTSCGNNLHFQF